MKHPKQYGSAEGPLGFPMHDRIAKAVEKLMRELPKSREYEYRKAVLPQAATELNPGERSDVSWISTEAVDRAHDVVLASGMDDSQFAQNPIVTLCHAYQIPPVGKSIWRKRARDGSTLGIKAKTIYPPRPTAWPDAEIWMPDKVFGLVQSGLARGKSIGFLPLKVRAAAAVEIEKYQWPSDVLVIESWLLLEYACCWLPENQEAIVQEVAKGQRLSLENADAETILKLFRRAVPFTTAAQIAKAVRSRLERLDAGQLVEAALDRIRGRV